MLTAKLSKFYIPSNKLEPVQTSKPKQDCRVCDKVIGEHGVTVDSEVPDMGADHTFSTIYLYLFGFEPKDGPQGICWSCSKALTSAYILRKKIEENELAKRRMENEDSETENPLIEPMIVIKEEPLEMTQKQEEEDIIRCPLCEYKSNVKDNYQKHVVRVHNRQEMKCDGCEEKFHLIYLLEEHRTVSHKFTHAYKLDPTLIVTEPKPMKNEEEEMIQCPLCEYRSSVKGNYQKHVVRLHKRQKMKCDGCDEKFHLIYLLDEHRKYEHEFDHPYKVDESLKMKTPTRSLDYYKFKKSDAKQEIESFIDDESQKDFISCPLCSHCCNNSSSFRKHYRSMHENLEFQCDGCSHRDYLYYRLLRHRKISHDFDHEYKIEESLILEDKCRREQKRIKKGKKFPCPECEQWFKKKSLISKHLHVVHKIKPRPKGRPATVDHKQDTNSPKKNYIYPTYQIICTFCGKVFANNTIKSHIRNMHPEHCDPYICAYCDTEIKTKRKLLYHMQKIHDFTVKNARGTEITYTCNFCPKTFGSTVGRKTHEIRYHTFDYEFTCKLCEKKFVNKIQFNDHLKRHADGKRPNLRCDVCHEYFTRKQALARHVATHFGSESENMYADFMPQNLIIHD